MDREVELFFSFRSPYSYLAGPRAFALPERYDIDLVFRGVRPMAMRGQPLPRAKQLYIMRDATREARRLGLPWGNIFDPLGDAVWRCLTIAEHAVDVGKIAPFVLRVTRAIWSEGAAVIEDDVLRPLCEEVGLGWDACREAMENPAYRERVERSTARLDALGHWGVPTFVFRDELYWGQDRIEDLEYDLREAGLARA